MTVSRWWQDVALGRFRLIRFTAILFRVALFRYLETIRQFGQPGTLQRTAIGYFVLLVRMEAGLTLLLYLLDIAYLRNIPLLYQQLAVFLKYIEPTRPNAPKKSIRAGGPRGN